MVEKKKVFVAAVIALIGLVAFGGPALAAGTLLTATSPGRRRCPIRATPTAPGKLV